MSTRRPPLPVLAALATVLGVLVAGIASATPPPPLAWEQTYNSPGNLDDQANGVAIAPDGSIVVVGTEDRTDVGRSNDILIRKYDSAGSLQWTRSSNGPGNFGDYGLGSAIDAGGNIFVVANSDRSDIGHSYDWLIMKWDAGGTLQWSVTCNLVGNSWDNACDIAVDASGSVYAVGMSAVPGRDWHVIKFAPLDGAIVWHDVYNYGSNDYPQSVAVDPSGDIVVAGYVGDWSGAGLISAVRKYTAGGDLVWTMTRSTGNENGYGGVAVDSTGTIACLGSEIRGDLGQSRNWFLQTYGATGATQWLATYNSPANGDDGLEGNRNVAVDAENSIVAVGYETRTDLGQGKNWLVRRYNPAGVLQWSMTYDGAAHGDDTAGGVAYGADGSIVVVGYEAVAGQGKNWAVRKYAPVVVPDGDLDWGRAVDMPTDRVSPGVCGLSGKLYVVGGADAAVLGTVEAYDPASNTWTTKASMPTARVRLVTEAVGGKLYAIGGGTVSSETPPYTTVVEAYDPATNTWTTRAGMPTARDACASAVVGGKIYVIGGRGGARKVEVYDPAANTWATRADAPVDFVCASGTAVNGKMYLFGGYVAGNTQYAYEYNPDAGSWRTLTNMPTAGSDTVAVALNDRVYVIGGDGRNPTVEEYDTNANTWTTKASLYSDRIDTYGAVLNGKIYVAGGFDFVTPYFAEVDAVTYRGGVMDVSTEVSGPALRGQWITVTMTVTNVGAEAAQNVTPALATGPGVGLVGPISGPVPPGPVTLNPGDGVTFAWTCSAVGVGNVTFTMTVMGGVTASSTATLGSRVSASIYPWGGTITTVAGTGSKGYNGDGIPATTAQTNGPEGFAVDSVGNRYIAERFGNRVRKVSVASGLISTVAGTGTGAYNSDGISATVANVSGTDGVALDPAGNLFIADRDNNRIRKVDATTGLISTVAGTGTYGYNGDGILATAAQLRYPSGIAIFSGNLYITDNASHRIRKVVLASGLISTVAGTGTGGYNTDGVAATTAQLNWPNGVALDAVGNLYIADGQNHRVRKVDAVSGLISTVAGTGTTVYNGEGIPATTAGLNVPCGIHLDPAGNLYVGEYFANRIRRVDAATGLIYIAAGTGTEGYNGDGIPATTALLHLPAGIDQDASGNLYITDRDGHRVRRVAPSAWLATSLSLSSTVVSPGQWIQAWLTVTNTGSNAATGVTPALQVNTPAGLVVLGGATPAGPVTLNGGASQTFAWTLSATAGGVASFTVTAGGMDSMLGSPILGRRVAGVVVTAARLTANLVVAPGAAGTGQWFTARLTISNTGAAAANGVVPSMGFTSGAGLVVLESGPLPPGPVTLGPGSSTTFTWTYSVSGNGMVGFNATASGTDAVMAVAVQGSATRTFVATQDPLWTPEAPMPTARRDAGTAVVGGTVYVVGGNDGAAGYARTEAYDPATDSWATLASLPTGRYGLGVVAVGGTIYAIGGGAGGGALSVVEAYDPATNTWTTRAAMPTAREYLATVVIGGTIYAIGGENGTGGLTIVEAYDTATNTWTTKAGMPTAREGLSAVVVGGRIYAIGGANGGDTGVVEVYDPATDSWTTLASMPTARSGLTVVFVNVTIYAMGGSNGGVLSTVEAYDPAADAWTTKASLPAGCEGLAAAVIGNTIYTVGGWDGSAFVSTVHAAYVTPSSLAPPPSAPPAPPLLVKVKPKSILIGPNVLDRSDPGSRLSIAARGKAGGRVTIEIFDEGVRLVRTLHLDLDGDGLAAMDLDGRDDHGKHLAYGLYWVLARDGGVSDRKQFMIVSKRKR
ncbi:MAG: kelch repeat-containing protein [Candidatus Coatesbacteria bacterium]